MKLTIIIFKLKHKNSIKGILYIIPSEINENIVLFNSEINCKIDIYINNKKIKISKDITNSKYLYNFKKEGKHSFDIVFYDKIINLENFLKNVPI